MTTIYIVRDAGFIFGTLAHVSDDPKELLVVWDGKSLPINVADLIVLHGSHANRSRKMMANNAQGTFDCFHCRAKVPFSGTLFKRLLSLMGSGFFGLAEHKGVTIRLVRLVEKLPVLMPLFDWDAIYAIEKEV
jgi:hypothetical protein